MRVHEILASVALAFAFRNRGRARNSLFFLDVCVKVMRMQHALGCFLLTSLRGLCRTTDVFMSIISVRNEMPVGREAFLPKGNELCVGISRSVKRRVTGVRFLARPGLPPPPPSILPC